MKADMKYFTFLFIGLMIGISVSAQTSKRERRTMQGNKDARSYWEFNNFGKNAEGKVEYGKDEIVLSTQNTLHCFFQSDSYSFAYRKHSFPYDDCSRLTVTAKVGAFSRGAAGIMMRSGSRPDAANVHLEVSATGDVLLFARKADGEQTTYKRITSLAFPIELKLVRQGTVFTGYYKNKTGRWIKGTSLVAEAGTEPLVGFYACLGTESQIGYSVETKGSMKVIFSDWALKYKEDYIPAEKDFVDTMPVRPGTLLRDNFNDGSLSNLPESITNPVWKGIKYGILPYDKQGGRYWKKTGDGTFCLGDKKWADYEVSVDLTLDPTMSPSGEFMMQLRYQNISVYAKMTGYYAVVLRNGNKLFFEKYKSGNVKFSKEIDIPGYLDGNRHTLSAKLIDRNYEVFYDGRLLIMGTDTIQPITYGNIALKFTDALINIDNLEVTRMDDPVNGSVDNYLLDYFDRLVPAFLKNYGY